MSKEEQEEEQEAEQHVLSDFLRERLTALGLDYDTYGPYVLPLLTDEEHDDEEWETVLELLQASSETHCDDDEAWTDLRTSIEQQWKHHQSLTALAAQKHEAERHALYQEALKEEREQMHRDAETAAASAAAAAAAGGATPITTNATEPDAAKRALLARFAYEAPEEDEDGEDDAPVLTNRQVAEKAAQEAAAAMRGKSVQTKNEERTKTKAAKQQKVQAKEERRQRATKGERKR
jgi:hypothetical protein